MITLYNLYRFIKTLIRGIKEDNDFKVLSIIMLLLISGSTVFYVRQEGWSIIDALYFSVMTMSTVGYGDLVPSTNISKIFTIFFTFVGIGTFVAFTAKLVTMTIDNHNEDQEKKRLKKAEENKKIK